LIGIGVGAIIGGVTSIVSAHNAGVEGGHLALAFFGGALLGAALGAAGPLGAGAMLGTIGGGMAFGIMAAATIGAGMANYVMQTFAHDRDFNVGHMFLAGGVAFAQGTLAFGLGALTASAGLWGTPRTGSVDRVFATTTEIIARNIFIQTITFPSNLSMNILFSALA